MRLHHPNSFPGTHVEPCIFQFPLPSPSCIPSLRAWHASHIAHPIHTPPARIHPRSTRQSSSPPSAAASHHPASTDTQQTSDSDTIVAVITGPTTQGAVSIIRLSGDDAIAIATSVFSSTTTSTPSWNPESHRIYYGHACDCITNQIIDEVLCLVMRGPRSFTAQDVVELHTHGGGVCAQRVLQSCLSAGARLAKPGEFTLRAFLNGRLDLTQAESVAALVEARTVAAADSALAGLDGGLAREIQCCRQECVDLLVEMDARLDFEEDLPPLDVDAVAARIHRVSARIEDALSTAKQGQLLRSGLQVALVGRPNVGKSSLLNALSGTERAIVTEIAGTTRDVVEAGIVIGGGIPITLLDTAGLRDNTDDAVERIGVARSLAAAKAADVVVMVVDGEQGWGDEDGQIFDSLLTVRRCVDDGSDTIKMPASLLVVNKVDRMKVGDSEADQILPEHVVGAFSAHVYTSAVNNQGMEELKAALLELVGAPELVPGGVSWAVNERQAEALTRSCEALRRVQESMEGDLPIDFWTIDVRGAVLALGEVSGEDVTEQVLDSIFSRFCIGK